MGTGSPSLRETIDSHDNNYTFLRLILASLVIYYHSFGMTLAGGYRDYVTGLVYPTTSAGGLAVQAFFFLSGVFVTQSYCRDQSVPAFIAKRVLRIWPGLFVCLLVTALLSVAVARPADWARYLAFDGLYEYVLRNARFKLTWEIEGLYTSHPYRAINGPIHTLPLEAKMYAVLAVVGLLGLLRNGRRVIVAGVLLLLAAVTPGVVEALPGVRLFDQDYSRVAGAMFMAGVLTYGLARWIRPRLWQGAVALALTLASTGLAHVFAFYALVIWALLWLGQWAPLGRLVRPRADLSYGIYLYGWPCQQMVTELFPRLQPYVLMLAALALATLLAALSWRWVEKPAIALGKHLGQVRFRVWQRPWPAPARSSALSLLVLLLACVSAQWVSRHHPLGRIEAMPARILDFGPHEARVGEVINRQPDGRSALWLRIEGAAPPGTRVVFDGTALDTQVAAGLVTAAVPAILMGRAGDKSIHLEYRSLQQLQRSNAVVMQVRP